MRKARLELCKEAQKFSAGHFTIFSATHRERLHGHNFTVGVTLDGAVDEGGLMGDYRTWKLLLEDLCAAWNEVTLLPGRSPHLALRREGDLLLARFDGRDIPFLADDVLVLPVRNITVEELSAHFLEVLRERAGEACDTLDAIEVRVSSGPGQWGVSTWRAPTPNEETA